MASNDPTKVIEHRITGERFMYPQNLATPHNFTVSQDQTPVPLVYPVTNNVRWEAESQNPLDMKRW